MTLSADIDLQELAIRRERNGQPTIAPRRRVVSRIILPGLLIAGFTTVLAWAARDVYLPRTPVTVVPVRLSLSELQAGGTPLFNAAGWVEPRPTPIRVAALASGVVEELLVVEDQFVMAGDPIARLVDEDAQLMLDHHRATLRLRESEIRVAQAQREAAQVNFDIPAHLELPVAEAEAALAAIETQLSDLPHRRRQAEARLRFAKYDLETSQALGSSASRRSVEQARSQLDAATAEVAELTNRQPALQKQRAALNRQMVAAEKRLELKTDEQQALEEARARMIGAQSQLRQSEVAVAEAELRLSRMTISAPVEGRILNLVAQPGSQLSVGTGSMPGEDRSTVVKMYEPDRLQVRVDVRFEDLPQAGRGQPVEIRSPAVSEPLTGQVLFLTGFANIQKNTLEVKVSVDKPPPVLKPEMLVDVTFLAPETPASEVESSEQFRLFVPTSLVERDGDAAWVWVADIAQQTARRQRVQVASTRTPGAFVEVAHGLTAASRLIVSGRDQVRDGDRISVTGEDPGFAEDSAGAAVPERFTRTTGR